MTYFISLFLFMSWIIGLVYFDAGPAILILPLAGLFIVAMAQSRRKKIINTL